MEGEAFALIVHNEIQGVRELKAVLQSEFIPVQEAQTSEEAAGWLRGSNPPHLVFTATSLPDGTWADVLRCAEEAHEPVDVIVLSEQMDEKLYIEAIQCGAYDFLSLPLAAPDLDHVVRCAVGNVRGRRQTLAHTA